jgi:hypothetical protein
VYTNYLYFLSLLQLYNYICSCFPAFLIFETETMNTKRLLLQQESNNNRTNSHQPASTFNENQPRHQRRVVQQSKVIKKNKTFTKNKNKSKKKMKKKTNSDSEMSMIDLQDEGVILRTVEATRARANSLTELNLTGMLLGQRGGISIASALRVCCKLESLNLASNFIGSGTKNFFLFFLIFKHLTVIKYFIFFSL